MEKWIIIGFIILFFFLGLVVVPQKEEWIIERLGRFSRTLKPGLNFIIPYIEYVKAKVPTKDIIYIEPQKIFTKDLVKIEVDIIVFIKVKSSEKAVYEVEYYPLDIEYLLISTFHTLIGNMTLEEVLKNRDKIKLTLKKTMNKKVKDWGIIINSIEIQRIEPIKK